MQIEIEQKLAELIELQNLLSWNVRQLSFFSATIILLCFDWVAGRCFFQNQIVFLKSSSDCRVWMKKHVKKKLLKG